MKKICFALILSILLSGNIPAAEPFDFEHETLAIKAGFTGMLTRHMPDFSIFSGGVDCGKYQSGENFNWGIAAGFEKYISKNLCLGINLGYFSKNSTLISAYNMPARDISGEVVTVDGENRLEADLSSIAISPYIAWDISPEFISRPLRIYISTDIYELFPKKDFSQTEEIISPANAYFIQDGRRTQSREITSGELASLNSFPALLRAGLELYSPAGNDWAITNHLSVGYHLNNYLNDADWKSFSISLGIGLRFGFVSRPEPPAAAPLPALPPAPDVPPPPLKEEIYVRILKTDFRILTGEELIATQPVVNAIFFNANSAEIPDIYINDTNAIIDFSGDPMELHRKVLPVVASIMKDNPESHIKLMGYTAGLEFEPAGIALAENRTAAVADALISLGIDKSRIRKSAALLPEYPSNTEFAEGIEDNRRVDLDLVNAPLQRFVARRDFERLEGNIETLVSYKNIPNKIPVIISASHTDSIIIAQSPNIFDIHISKRIDANFNNRLIVRANAGSLFARDTAIIDTTRMPVERNQFDLGNFEAFLRFDYNQTSLSGENKRLLKQLAEMVPDGTSIRILGGADVIGSRESNLELALRRAETTRQYIESVTDKPLNIEIGINEKKFPEDSPQGRFLNRSVRIILGD
ncbi:MAG: hypothetical protein ACLFQX_11940 [Candidatus Kapaibacterium sp.]